MTIADATDRAEALDVVRSFCVTAPAGSGKTELLIQRFLALLARVKRPEQVLAITFTRKAAAEMRERVLQALQAARDKVAVEGEHQRVTRDLALAALESSGEQDNGIWLSDISRLNIKTIDSFCAGLTRQMPILSRFGGQAQAVDDASPHSMQEAVSELFGMIARTARSLRRATWMRCYSCTLITTGIDFRELLVTMLAKRDQWHLYTWVPRRSPLDRRR